MFRYVLSLTFAVGIASAATISTTATCDGVTTVGTFGAHCNDGRFQADANLSVFPFQVFVGALPFAFPATGSATANFSDDYVFTVFGGTGDGAFFPCFSGGANAGASVGMSFAGIGLRDLSPGANDNCFPNGQPNGTPKPFTFGVPQIVHVDVVGSAAPPTPFRGAGGSESLYAIRFYDPVGNLLSNVNYTLVSVPEPSALSLLSIGLMFLTVAVRRISNHQV